MTFAHLIDLLTGASSLGLKFVGFPSQMRANHKAWRQGLPAGMVWRLAAGMCAVYLLWVLDGLVNHDWTVVIGQGFGVLVTAPLAIQAILCDRRIRHAQASTPSTAPTAAAASSRNSSRPSSRRAARAASPATFHAAPSSPDPAATSASA